MTTPLRSFLKVQILAAHLYEQPLSKEDKAWLKDNLPSALEFMAEHKFLKRDQKVLTQAVGEMIKGAGYEEISGDFHHLATSLRAKLPKLTKDTSIKDTELKLLRDIVLVNRKGSDAAWARLQKSVGQLRDPMLSGKFTAQEMVDPEPYKAAVRKAVKRLTGKEADTITAEQVKELREAKPELYKAFTKARNELGKVGREAHRSFVRGSGEHLVDADEAKRFANKHGYVHAIPQGFEGKLDEDGKLYTKYGELIRGAPGASVRMNPDYVKGSTEHVFISKPRFGETEQHAYTMHAKSVAAKRKAEKVEDLTNSIDEIRKKWLKDLNSDDAKRQTLAAMLETIYQTSARVGNKGSQKAGIKTTESRFGLTTLQGKHIKVEPSKAIFSYLGKSAQRQRHVLPGDTLTNKKVLKIMSKLKEGKRPTEDFWTVGKKTINSGMLNKYFQELGSPTTVHKLRHMRGNQILQEEFKHKPKTKDEARINNFLLKSLTKVGKQLGHFNKGKVTPGTALQAYVTPGIVEKYYKDYGTRPPAKVQKVIDAAHGEQGLRSVHEEGHKEPSPTKAVRPAKLKQPSSIRPAKLSGPVPKWFARKTGAEQREYIKNHPRTRYKPTKI
jgi:DNA topoisomerase-1